MRSGKQRTSAPKNSLRGVGLKALATLAIAALGAVMIPASAQAAVVSQAEGRLLTVSILGVDSGPVLALNGATATNPFGAGNVSSDVPLNASALNAITLTTGGVNLFRDAANPLVPGIISLGAVGQYAGANNDGSSVAFSGTVTEAASLVGVGTTVTGSNVGTPGPDAATITVGTNQLLGTADLVDLDIHVGAVAASANQSAAGVVSGDYTVANLSVNVGGDLLDVPFAILSPALDTLLAVANPLLGGTPLANPLATGELEITLADLLATVPGVTSIDQLPAGTDLLSLLPAAVVAKVTTLVNNILTAVGGLGGAVPVAVIAAHLVIDPVLAGLAASLTGPLGAAVTALVQLPVNNQTLNPDGSWTQNALTIGVGAAGSLASVRLANATVGPNAGPAGVVPVITSLAPTSGPETGGTVVTITGGGFTNATGVTFDGIGGSPFVVNSDTSITVTTPPHAIGPVNVVVQHPNGASLPGSFTYLPVIAATQIDPDFGPEAGGTLVTITGDCLAGATDVLFDGVPGTGFSETGGVITVTTPAGAAGPADVTIVGAPGCGTLVVPDGFLYISILAAVLTSITPGTGPDTGGTLVTIRGTGFTGATGVAFDGVPGRDLTVISDTQLTVVTPAHAAGPVDVVVGHPVNGPSAPFLFTYVPGTTITTVTPPTGPTGGGTTVTISGTCFTGATGVLFGATPAASFTVVSATQIRAVTPAGVGVVDVAVVGAPACGTAVADDAFTFVASGLAYTGTTVSAVPVLLIGVELLLGGLVLGLVALLRRRKLA